MLLRNSFFFLFIFGISVVLAQNQWTSMNGPWRSNDLRDLAIGYFNGSNTPVLYMAQGYSGLLKSTNAGESWIHIDAIQNPSSVACVKNNPDVVYAGVFGQGVFKSIDGGITWEDVTHTIQNLQPNRIAISPNNQNVVYVGMQGREGQSGELLYYTTNGGQGWTSVPDFQDKNFTVTEIVCNPQIDAELFISASIGDPQQTGVYRRNPEEGIWERRVNGMLNTWISSVAFSSNYPESAIMYAANAAHGNEAVQLYKSFDKGEHWTAVYGYPGTGSSIMSVEIDPTNPEVAYLTARVISQSFESVILKTTDGGEFWYRKNQGIGFKHIGKIFIEPQNSSRLYLMMDGCFYRSVNGGDLWFDSNDGIQIVSVGGVAVTSTKIYTNGSYALGYYEFGTAKWRTSKLGGHGPHRVVIEPYNDQYVYAAIPAAGDLDGIDEDPEAAYGYLRISSDGGITWFNSLKLYHTSVFTVAVDPNKSSTVYAALSCGPNRGIWKSTNRGLTWSTSSIDQEVCQVWDIVIDPTSSEAGQESSVIYVGTVGGIRKTEDGGTTWKWVNIGLPSDSRIRELALDTRNPAIVYAGAEDIGMWKTTNGGEEWFEINSGIDIRTVQAILLDERAPNLLYCSIYFPSQPPFTRIYTSLDGGSQWNEINIPFSALALDMATKQDERLPYVYTGTTEGVHRLLPNLWQGTISQNTIWSGTVYVIGNVEVAQGVILQVLPGTQVKFFPGTQLTINGILYAVGTEKSRIVFTHLDQGYYWRGIRLSTTPGSRIEYADIFYTNIGISSPHKNAISITNCNITFSDIGIHLFNYPNPSEPFPSVVRNNYISQSSTIGILVDSDASNVIIQDNILEGINNGDVGIQFVNSSPLEVLHNRITGYGKAGIECFSASPSFVSENGGMSCIVNNRIGVSGEASSNFILGMIDEYNAPGYNSIAYNEKFEILLADNCLVYSQMNYHYERNFNIDESSRLIYEPDLDYDPNGCLESGHRSVIAKKNTEKKGDNESPKLSGFIENPLVKQAIKLRLQRQHTAAIGVLKGLIAVNGPNVELICWSLYELLANYQMVPNPSGSNLLSGYLRRHLNSHQNSEVRRAIRQVLSNALLHERDIAGTLTAIDTIIHLYPNTLSELIALYSKVSLAVNVMHDYSLAQTTLQIMQIQYSSNSLTRTAEVLFGNAGAQRPLSKSGPVATKSTSYSLKEPLAYTLEQNFPNPFNPTTQIKYAVGSKQNAESGKQFVTLKVFDLLGREIATLVNEPKQAGEYEIEFDASKYGLTTGIYFYHLKSGEFTATKKFIYLK